MSTSWTKEEDQRFIKLMKKISEKDLLMKEILMLISQEFNKTPEQCLKRWGDLMENQEMEKLKNKVTQLEKVIQAQGTQLKQIKKDLSFHEILLLEEYRILMRLLGEDKINARIHQA